MSTIDNIIQSAHGGRLIANLSDRFGLAAWQVEAAVSALQASVAAAAGKAGPRSLGALIDATGAPEHAAAFAGAEGAASPASVEAGHALAERLFGSPSAAGEVAQLVARESGLRADVAQRLLPVVVAVLAGGIASRLARGASAAGDAAQESSPPPEEQAPRTVGFFGALAAAFGSLFGRRPEPAAGSAPLAASSAEAEGTTETLEQFRQIIASAAPAGSGFSADLDQLLGRTLAGASD
jgi:hypothetical protein